MYNKVAAKIKLPNFIFWIWKRIDFARKNSLGKCILHFFIFKKVFLVLQDI